MGTTQTQKTFDWGVYADATFAGLAVLIPIPLLDMVFEAFFRRRMPVTIAKRRQIALDKTTLGELRKGRGCSPAGCVVVPLWLAFQFLKRLSRKILYFLTIKEATDMLSAYWHRAFLLDHMLQSGYLAPDVPTVAARDALEQTLENVTTSPLNQLAQQVIGNTHHSLRSLWRIVRRQKEDEDITGNKQLMGRRWREYEDYWERVAALYDTSYQQRLQSYAAEVNSAAVRATEIKPKSEAGVAAAGDKAAKSSEKRDMDGNE